MLRDYEKIKEPEKNRKWKESHVFMRHCDSIVTAFISQTAKWKKIGHDALCAWFAASASTYLRGGCIGVGADISVCTNRCFRSHVQGWLIHCGEKGMAALHDNWPQSCFRRNTEPSILWKRKMLWQFFNTLPIIFLPQQCRDVARFRMPSVNEIREVFFWHVFLCAVIGESLSMFFFHTYALGVLCPFLHVFFEVAEKIVPTRFWLQKPCPKRLKSGRVCNAF